MTKGPAILATAGNRAGWIIPLILAASVALAYADSLHDAFFFDDGNAILENQSIHTLWPFAADAPLHPPDYVLDGRPLVILSLALNYHVGGLDPFGYHLVNLASHLACTLLLYGLVRRTLLMPRFAPDWPEKSAARFAGATALLWALHPLQTEAVTYVTQRTETFMAMFMLLMLYAVARAATAEKSRIAWRIIAVAACAAGMMCKEVMVVAPFIALLYDWMFLPRRPAAAGIWTHGALFATLLILPVELRNADLQSKSGYGLKYVNWFDYLKTQGGVIVHYLRLSVFPRGLLIDYFGWPIATDIRSALIPCLFIFVLLAASVIAAVRRSWIGFLGLWFFFILAPTSSVLPNFTEIVAERRMYLPLASLVILFLAAVWKILHRPGARALIVGLLAIVLGISTAVRNREFATEDGVWLDVIAKQPENAHAHSSLAMVYGLEGKWARALDENTIALQLLPRLAAAQEMRPWILSHLPATRPDTPS